MPFQPYKSERGPDFISLALQLRREQRQEESQNRRDEAALIRARSQAENDALSRREKELEIDRIYRTDLANAARLSRAVTDAESAVEGGIRQLAPAPSTSLETALEGSQADAAFDSIAGNLARRAAFERQGERELEPLQQASANSIVALARRLAGVLTLA